MCWRNIKFCGYVNGMEIGLNYTKAKLVYFDIKPNTIRVLMRVSLKLETCDMPEYHNIFMVLKTFD
jgi:hypothetical protein